MLPLASVTYSQWFNVCLRCFCSSSISQIMNLMFLFMEENSHGSLVQLFLFLFFPESNWESPPIERPNTHTLTHTHIPVQVVQEVTSPSCLDGGTVKNAKWITNTARTLVFSSAAHILARKRSWRKHFGEVPYTLLEERIMEAGTQSQHLQGLTRKCVHTAPAFLFTSNSVIKKLSISLLEYHWLVQPYLYCDALGVSTVKVKNAIFGYF